MIDKQTKRKLRRIWCERLIISLCMPVTLGFAIIRAPLLNNYTNQRYAYQQALGLPGGQSFRLRSMSNSEGTGKQEFVLVTKVKIEAIAVADMVAPEHELGSKLITKQEYEQISKLQQTRDKLGEQFLLELTLLMILASGFIAMLLLLLRQQNRISLTLTGQLICFFPEECIAELEALHQQMKSEQRSTWLIRMIMLRSFLELFLALYVQINIENLWLPQHRGRKNIDE